MFSVSHHGGAGMKPHRLAVLAAVLGVAGCTAGNTADTSTSATSTQGRSTATITQEGGSSPMIRRVIRRGPNSQTIVQQQGGNSVTIRQGVDQDTEDLDELEGDDW